MNRRRGVVDYRSLPACIWRGSLGGSSVLPGEPGSLVGMGSAMRSLPHSPVRDSPLGARSIGDLRRDHASAEAQLGPAHPLVALLAGLQTSVEQMCVVAAVAVIGSVFLLGERRSPLALLIGAGAAEVIPIARWVTRRVAVRDVCLDLVIENRRGVRIRVLERERRRVAERRHRATLARSITGLVEAAQRPCTRPRALPVFNVCVVRSVAPELCAIADRLLAARRPAVQGVALMEQLLRNGVSPLYGSEVEPLRRELGRARFLLEDSTEAHLRERGTSPAGR